MKNRSQQLYEITKRCFDLFVVLIAGILLLLPMFAVALAVKLTSKGPALYWSTRIGRHNQPFQMPKFRTMRIGTPAVATHLLPDPASLLTPIGGFLRRSSLDELPQLWSILAGHMSLVGPRPALFNQSDLIEMRTALGVDQLLPGLTGWAQVNGRDDIAIPVKVGFDGEYLARRSFWFDLHILYVTFLRVIKADGVSH